MSAAATPAAAPGAAPNRSDAPPTNRLVEGLNAGGKRIKNVTFGLLSTKEMERLAVLECDNRELYRRPSGIRALAVVMYVKRTAPAVRRCQHQQKRRSYGRKRKDARRYDLDAQGHGDYKGNLHEQMVDVFRRADIPRTGRGGTAALT